jgi:hypothetical protein
MTRIAANISHGRTVVKTTRPKRDDTATKVMIYNITYDRGKAGLPMDLSRRFYQQDYPAIAEQLIIIHRRGYFDGKHGLPRDPPLTGGSHGQIRSDN